MRASKEGRSAAPRPLPNEVDGPLSLFVDFHGITEGGLLGILRTSYGQLSPGPGSGGSNYVFAKGFLANGSGSEDARNETLSASSQKAREEQQACMWGHHRGVYVGHSAFTGLAKLLRRSGAGEDNDTASHGSLTKMA